MGTVFGGNLSTGAVLMAITYVLFTFGNNAMKMVVSVSTSAFRMDVVDYEMDRSGKYMPATVSATYSFIDKIVSSFGATIATLMIGLIGYTTTAPQQGDPLTFNVRVMTSAYFRRKGHDRNSSYRIPYSGMDLHTYGNEEFRAHIP